MQEDKIEVRERLRREALERRNAIPSHLQIAFSHLIRASALSLIEEQAIGKVHCYLSFRSEVDTSGLVHALRLDGIRVIAPVLQSIGNELIMTHYPLFDAVTTGPYGIPEPVKTEPDDLAGLGMVILPLAAFDGFGTRLGYGKGFYDKFLSSLPPEVFRMGLAYSIQECDEIPRLGHDQQLDIIVTEQSVVRIPRV